MTVFIILLFILQIISFYIIALLYMKQSKFNELERKQQRIMEEMDDAIAAYLTELKDENDRLIETLANRSEKEKIEEKDVFTTRQPFDAPGEPIPTKAENRSITPIAVALRSYQTAPTPSKFLAEEKQDDRSIAINMHEKGKTIEEIAKHLGKGKTEIELLLKFK